MGGAEAVNGGVLGNSCSLILGGAEAANGGVLGNSCSYMQSEKLFRKVKSQNLKSLHIIDKKSLKFKKIN